MPRHGHEACPGMATRHGHEAWPHKPCVYVDMSLTEHRLDAGLITGMHLIIVLRLDAGLVRVRVRVILYTGCWAHH